MRSTKQGALAVLATAVAALALVGPGRAADTSYAGTWKVTVADGSGVELSLWLVQLEAGKALSGKVLSVTPSFETFKGSTVESVKEAGGALRMQIKAGGTTFHVTGYPPKGKEKPTALLGTVWVSPANVFPMRMEKTTLKAIEAKGADKKMEGADDLQKALDEDGDDRLKAVGAVLKKYPGKPIALVAAQTLFNLRARGKIDADAAGAAAAAYLKEAVAYGREMELFALQAVNSMLMRSSDKKVVALGLEYARQAAKAVKDDDLLAVRVSVLSLLIESLKKAGKKDEAKELTAKLEKLEDAYDVEYEKTALPFKLTKYAGREGKSDRVAVVELFTGAQCPPCVAADMAFDACLKTYTPKEVVFLQYHLHIPRADPLTNADTAARAKYYGKDVTGTPTMFVDGKVTEPMGGPAALAAERYKALRKLLNNRLEVAAAAKVKLGVKRDGDTLDLEATVDLPEKAGKEVKLRLVLVEDVVRYVGGNGLRLHHHVVRDFPGGVKGIALGKKSSTHKATVKLGDLRKKLDDYLTKYAEDNEDDPFLDDRRPLALKKLKVVALVQDDEDKKVLQAVQVDVPAAKK